MITGNVSLAESPILISHLYICIVSSVKVSPLLDKEYGSNDGDYYNDCHTDNYCSRLLCTQTKGKLNKIENIN